MQERRAKISFWLTIISFFGSLGFLLNVLYSDAPADTKCKECVEKLLYYQHRADSLETFIEQKSNSK